MRYLAGENDDIDAAEEDDGTDDQDDHETDDEENESKFDEKSFKERIIKIQEKAVLRFSALPHRDNRLINRSDKTTT